MITILAIAAVWIVGADLMLYWRLDWIRDDPRDMPRGGMGTVIATCVFWPLLLAVGAALLTAMVLDL